MHKLPVAAVAAACMLFTTACATRTGTASRTTVPPAGPVYTSTTERGVIPAGTELVLRTNETISTEQAASGTTYSAEVARAIVNYNGDTIVPNGAPAQLSVVEASSGGTFGTADLALAVRSITVGGRSYPIATDVVEQEAERGGLGANQRTATMVGGGALLGTLIGAIAGGGSGAAIGAAIGAAGGAATQVLTKGDRVHVPAETLLTFRLDQPIRLVGYSQ